MPVLDSPSDEWLRTGFFWLIPSNSRAMIVAITGIFPFIYFLLIPFKIRVLIMAITWTFPFPFFVREFLCRNSHSATLTLDYSPSLVPGNENNINDYALILRILMFIWFNYIIQIWSLFKVKVDLFINNLINFCFRAPNIQMGHWVVNRLNYCPPL